MTGKYVFYQRESQRGRLAFDDVVAGTAQQWLQAHHLHTTLGTHTTTASSTLGGTPALNVGGVSDRTIKEAMQEPGARSNAMRPCRKQPIATIPIATTPIATTPIAIEDARTPIPTTPFAIEVKVGDLGQGD